jgi:hypothetical protein
MEQDDTKQLKKKKSGINIKNIAILGVIFVVIIVAAVFLTSGFTSSLSGKYYSTYYGRINYDDYIEFSGKNTIKVYQYEILLAQGTYKLSENESAIQITLKIDGSGDTVNIAGSINNKNTVKINGEMYVKK